MFENEIGPGGSVKSQWVGLSFFASGTATSSWDASQATKTFVAINQNVLQPNPCKDSRAAVEFH